MRIYFKITVLLIIIGFSTQVFSQRLNISVYNKYNIRSIIVSPVAGKYELRSGAKLVLKMKRHHVVMLDIINDSIYVRTLTGSLGSFANLQFIGVGKSNYFRIKPIDPDYKSRDYDDDLNIYIKDNKFLIVNNVDIENYIAGVVQSEGGTKSPIEYYKSQAIICRTYALENLFRHIDEGFHLCDGVHCQAYFSKCLLSDDILQATYDTKGLIIVDTTLSLITATFHSNCGGQTTGSENVWLQPRSYLKSVDDKFCTSGRSAKWTKTITVSQWEKYLKKKRISTDSGIFNLNNYSFSQANRKKYYKYNGGRIPLKTIRNDWKLRSTFFEIKQEGNTLLFIGKGYGHGVGLCQEGAMEMAKQGYTYQQIIQFYYKNIFVVSLKALEFFKQDE